MALVAHLVDKFASHARQHRLQPAHWASASRFFAMQVEETVAPDEGVMMRGVCGYLPLSSSCSTRAARACTLAAAAIKRASKSRGDHTVIEIFPAS